MSNKNVAAAAAALALPIALLACSDGKSGSSAAPSGSPTSSAAGATASGPALATATAKPVSCAIDEAHYADWDEWGKACNFAVPKAVSALPPRITWEACGPALGLGGCKKLKVRAGATLHDVRAGARRPDVIEIGFVEECVTETSKHALLVIAEADGPTLAAFASKGHEAGKCDVGLMSIHQGAYTARLTVTGDAGPGASVGAPTQTSKPQPLRTWEAGHADKGAIASDVRWVSFGPNGAKTARWSDPTLETITENALNVEPTLHHDEILWSDVDTFVVKTAAKPEKLRGSDAGDSASSLGTDGSSLVFTHKPAAENGPISLVASPYATEPDKLAPSLVLPLPRRLDFAPWTVGCGYAAHAMAANDVLIARLKDGVSWTASSKGCDSGGLCLQKPIALTCTEVYFAAATKDGKEESLVRVTFAGLGKGKPPASPPAPLAASSGAPATSAPAAPAPPTATPKP